MIFNDVLKLLEDKIFSVSPKDDSLFNQYEGNNLDIDLPNAKEIRQENLRNYLRSFSERPSVIVIGEAPGWRGCRFSGVPFTSEFQLCDGSLPFVGKQSNRNRSPYKESTATIFWDIMKNYHTHFLAWNCVPFHPHEPGDPLSNRTPSSHEINSYIPILKEIISLVKPNRVAAIGRSAERALKIADITHTYVRHPSHGGKQDFRAGIEKLFA